MFDSRSLTHLLLSTNQCNLQNVFYSLSHLRVGIQKRHFYVKTKKVDKMCLQLNTS